MKVVGLITEYNPFHNGHKYHLEKSKEITGASHSISVMSGNFLQRGEPAILDKWDRAEIAVREGVDLVVELPTIYSCNSAEFFAFGGIRLLDSMNIVDYLCFGSENGNLSGIDLISDLLVKEPVEFKSILKKHLDTGLTFPSARQRAIDGYLGKEMGEKGLLDMPNNILGIEYLKAIKLLGSSIKPFTIERIKAHYHSTQINGDICSATAIRKLLEKDHHDLSALKQVIPYQSYEVIRSAINEGRAPIFERELWQIVLYRLRTIPVNKLKEIHDINEGLENRLKNISMTAASYEELISQLKTKRYTRTKLQRVLIKALLGITKEDMQSLSKSSLYIRVLGFSRKGAALLKKIKKSSDIPIITNLKRYVPQSKYAERMLEIDKIATDIYTLLYKNRSLSVGGLDYVKKPFISE